LWFNASEILINVGNTNSLISR